MTLSTQRKNPPLKKTKPFLAKLGRNRVLFPPHCSPVGCGHESILLDQARLLNSVCVLVSYCVCLFVIASLNVFAIACLCASLFISCPNGLSLYFESMCLPALLCVCLFVLVSLCWYMCSFPRPYSPLEVFLMHMASLAKAMCVCPCVFVFMYLCVFLSLCFCVFMFVCIHLPTCYSLLVVVVHMAGRAKAAGKSEEVIYPIRQDWEDTSHPLAPDLFNFNSRC